MNKSADFLLKAPAKKQTAKKQTKKPQQLTWKQRLSAQDYEQLRDVFLLFDEDGSGTIDPLEINKVFSQLGYDKSNYYIQKVLNAIKDKNKPIDFQQFVDCVCSKVGEYKTKDGLQRLFALYDKNQIGIVGFQQLKQVARHIGENMNDDQLMQLMHNTFISHKTSSNQGFNFQQFYLIVTSFNKRNNRT